MRDVVADSWETEFRHMHWQAVRTVVRRTLASVGTPPKVLDRFDNCGGECLVEWSETLKRYRMRASYCRNRHCRPCMRAKSNLMAINLRHRLEAGMKDDAHRFRFITLTLRHSQRPLKEQLDNLHRHFRLLRNSKIWKSSQRGGAAFIECGLNENGEWHPHLHIVSEGSFLKQDKLANEWMRITQGSFKVDVRVVKTAKDAAFYVAKYVSKGTTDEVWRNHNKAQEWILSTKGLRVCATFGSWRGHQILKHNPELAATDWKPVALLTTIIRGMAGGIVADRILLDVLVKELQYNPSKARERRPQPPA